MKITLPEGYIFDILSIYQVKILKSNNDKVSLRNFNNLLEEIYEQIGKERTTTIIDSKEYNDLYIANLATFDLVDLVKSDPCLGKQVDESNYNRYLKKVALQEKFFKSKITEIKIGY